MNPTIRFDADVVLAKLSAVRRCLEVLGELDDNPALRGIPAWVRSDLDPAIVESIRAQRHGELATLADTLRLVTVGAPAPQSEVL